MNILWSVGAFVLAIAVLVPIHELGHYSVARLCGVRVLRFSMGFGRVLLRRQAHPGATEWVLCAIPLGGYVRMLDEREAPVAEADRADAFNRKSVWQRIAVVAAGPIANLLLALVIYWITFMQGVTEMRPIVGQPAAESPAAHAGLGAGDEILAVAGHATRSWSDVRWYLLQDLLEGKAVELSVRGTAQLRSVELQAYKFDANPERGDPLKAIGLMPLPPSSTPIVGKIVSGGAADVSGMRVGDRIVSIDGRAVDGAEQVARIVGESIGRTLVIVVVREGRDQALKVSPRESEEQGERVGRIGIGFAPDQGWRDRMLINVRYRPIEALSRAGEKCWETTLFSLKVVGRLLTGQLSIKNVSGPVAIAGYAGESAQRGPEVFINFVAFLSLSIAIFNLLPIPVLDGGHIMYYLAEIIMRRPVRQTTLETGQQLGMLVLFTLMAVALYNDLSPLATALYNDFSPLITRLKSWFLS